MAADNEKDDKIQSVVSLCKVKLLVSHKDSPTHQRGKQHFSPSFYIVASTNTTPVKCTKYAPAPCAANQAQSWLSDGFISGLSQPHSQSAQKVHRERTQQTMQQNYFIVQYVDLIATESASCWIAASKGNRVSSTNYTSANHHKRIYYWMWKLCKSCTLLRKVTRGLLFESAAYKNLVQGSFHCGCCIPLQSSFFPVAC